jgi:hypothetical protein
MSVFVHVSLTPAMPLEGKLSPNSILDKAEEITLNRDIIGPESTALRGDELFTGILGGELVRIKNGKVNTITRLGLGTNHCGRLTHHPLFICNKQGFILKEVLLQSLLDLRSNSKEQKVRGTWTIVEGLRGHGSIRKESFL